MNDTMKSARFDLDGGDSDSHNYIHNESESYSAEDGKEEARGDESSSPLEKLKSSAADTLHQRAGWVLLVGASLSVLAICCWNLKLDAMSRGGGIFRVRVRNMLLMCSGCVFVFIAMNFILFNISFLGLKRSNNLNTLFYYANELSEHISAGMILVGGFLVVFLRDLDWCIYNKQGMDLFLSDVLSSLLIATFMLGAVKVFHRTISMNFNYSVYIKRIRRVLLEDAFVNLLGAMDSRKNRRIERPRLNGSQEMVYKSDTIASINEYLEELHGYSDPISELDLPRKRVLLKEFQRLMRRSSTIRGSVIQMSQKLKSKAGSKASKMIGKDRALGPMSDLSLYFHKPETFRFLMKEIGIDEGFSFGRNSLAEFIERTYRERHLLKENLEHMNSAIDKVAFGFKIMIGGLLLAMLYIKARGEGVATIGVISAFFGTQFLSNSLSASVVSSMIFLFFIHPYDIGDRIFVSLDGVEENLVVSELNVFSTVFYRWDGTYITILNTVLAQRAICNLRRSGIMAESHRIQINSRTNQKKLIRLKELIEDFVKGNPEDYTEYTMLNHDRIEDASKLHMKVYMQYKSSWQNFELYLRRKTKFLSFLNRALQELEIEYILPPRPISLRKGSE